MNHKHVLKLLGMLSLILSGWLSAYAQQKISGKVLDATNQPLPGVSVKIKNAATGTVTDINGAFSLTVPSAQSVLVFSFVGYVSQEASAEKSPVVITLAESKTALNEIVVVGYGTQKKSDLTGSITQLKASDVANRATGNILNAIQGRAAGVSVVTSPVPGSSPTIRIRGSNSISAGNNPLLVVDGFPLENANLNSFNNDDIATLDILKDASATAIYGSRGANGVIIITTKKGVAGQNNVNFSSYYGDQTPTRLVKLVSGQNFVDFINAAYTNSANRVVYDATHTPLTLNTDWQREMVNAHAPLQNYTLSFNGGSEKTRYLVSAGTFSQKGMFPGSDYKKYSVRTNLEQNVSNFLTVGTHLQLNRSITNTFDPGITNAFRYGWPTFPVRNADGSFYFPAQDPYYSGFVDGSNFNPVFFEQSQNLATNQTGANRVIGDMYAELRFGPHVKFRTNFGADYIDSKLYAFTPSIVAAGKTTTSTGSQVFSNEVQTITENQLSYNNQWGKHRLTATGVFSYQNHGIETATISGSALPTNLTGYYDVSVASVQGVPTSGKVANQLMSYTARLEYGFSDKYNLTATGRWDGSSRFGINNKWGFFPSMGLGWNVINEKFMDRIRSVVSYLKLRATVGVTGNQDIGNYKSIGLFSPQFYTQSNNLILGLNEGIGNADLKWEQTLAYDGGLDVNFLQDRITFSADYYVKNTTNLLYNVPIPSSSGFSSIYENIGAVQNKGIELALNVKVINGKNIQWSVGGNFSRNTNKIQSLYGDITHVLLSDNQGLASELVVGDALNSVYARKYDGLITNAAELAAAQAAQPKGASLLHIGSPKYVDVNGDGQITSADYVNIGSATPPTFYGLNTSFSYKGITLDVIGQGASGIATSSSDYNIFGDYQLLNRVYIPSQYAYQHMWNATTNPTGTYPMAGAKDVQFSDMTNGKINYFIVRNIKLGYTFKTLMIKKFAIKNLNIYVNAQNFLNYSSFRDGYNPEDGTIAYPYAKTILFGLNATF